MKLTCLECGKLFLTLQSHITRHHKITTQEYRDRHGQDTPFMSDETLAIKKQNGYSCWSIKDRVARGETEEDAAIAIREKHSKTFGPHTAGYSTTFWMTRYGMTIEQATEERNKRSCSKELLIEKYGAEEGNARFDDIHQRIGQSNSKLAMMARGYSEEEIRIIRDNISIPTLMLKYSIDEESASALRMQRLKNATSPRTVAFWSKKGYTQEEASLRVSAFQRRDIDFFIEKYGDVDGRTRYANWVKAATAHSVGKFASSESKKYFAPLIEWCESNGISVECEKYVRIDTKSYYIDLVIPSLMLAIEYDGSAFHADPLVVDENWKSAKGGYSYWDSILGDQLKTERIESIGYDVIRIHSSRKEKFNLIEIIKEYEQTRTI